MKLHLTNYEQPGAILATDHTTTGELKMATNFRHMDTDHLGPEATEADLAEFAELCEQVLAMHPEMDDDDVTEAVFGDGDYFRNAKTLGATIRA